MYVRIGEAATILGVAKSTLRRWESQEKFKADYKTLGGHRRYNMVRLLQLIHQIPAIKSQVKPTTEKRTLVVTYARVSGSKQREDLKTQQEQLKAFVETQGWT